MHKSLLQIRFLKPDILHLPPNCLYLAAGCRRFATSRQLMMQRQQADMQLNTSSDRPQWHKADAESRWWVSVWGLAPSGSLCTAEWFITQHMSEWPKSGDG